MQFKPSAIMLALSFGLTACGGGGGDTTTAITTPAPVPNNHVTPTPVITPTAAPDDLTPVVTPPPTTASEITITGQVYGATNNPFNVKICAGNTCADETTITEDGTFSYLAKLSQWPTEQPLVIEVASIAQPALKYRSVLGSWTELSLLDSNSDLLLDVSEHSDLYITPINLVMSTLALQQSSTTLQSRSNVTPAALDTPTKAQITQLKQLLSDNDALSKLALNTEQVTQLNDYVLELNKDKANSWDPNVYSGEIRLAFSTEQLTYLQAAQLDQIQFFTLNAQQIETLHKSSSANKIVQLPSEKLAEIQQRPVFTTEYLLSLAALLSATHPNQDGASIPVISTDLNALISALVQSRLTTPTQTALEAYQAHALAANVSLPTEIESLFNTQFMAFKNANYESEFKATLLALKPLKHLSLAGAFPTQFQQVKISVLLGAKDSPDKDSYHYTGEHPPRIISIPLTDASGKTSHQIDASAGQYQVNLSLLDTAGTFEFCQPGKRGEEWGAITDDNVQDTLTVVATDLATGVELRSVLGSMCELAKLDSNANGVLESQEYSRLNLSFLSTANTALLAKSTLTGAGFPSDWRPYTIAELDEKIAALPAPQAELIASMAALQAAQNLYGEPLSFAEEVSFYYDLLALLNIKKGGEYGRLSNNNLIPTVNDILTKLGEHSAVTPILLQNNDKNISHIMAEGLALLNQSSTDKLMLQQPAGNWFESYENSHLAAVCFDVLNDQQIIGLGIAGQGKAADGSYWVSLIWHPQAGAASYQVAWDAQAFNDINQAASNITVSDNRATIKGLTQWQAYQIRVSSNVGQASAPLTYTAGQKFISDTKVTAGLASDDSHRGRDSDTSCDPLSGQAVNSDRDGALGARYLKLDHASQPLARQDLSVKQLDFACAVDLQTGLVWQTRKQLKDSDPYSIHDEKNQFAYDETADPATFNGSCALPGQDALSSDPMVCNVANQIKWVNESNLCGLSNWRLPNVQEIYSLANLRGDQSVNFDTRYFPLSELIYSNYELHGLWLQEQHHSENKAMSMMPNLHVSTAWDKKTKPNTVQLVSDGFNFTTTQGNN
ncbi:DUF1566 domain-containing protein [Motilimonas cestriensis]|uniref:DUF1566 domain-containing protein n=1 Tax=Motilimonas cestriensis TaxID=2742685 RepID=A0ABS8WDV8_9GAMM|nr:DUF1566 domain-containing protein [Motilimonas cestriensis]MCE2596758.1 DUF1566 domain-containing protein [Motilimonas cestriensis]